MYMIIYRISISIQLLIGSTQPHKNSFLHRLAKGRVCSYRPHLAQKTLGDAWRQLAPPNTFGGKMS